MARPIKIEQVRQGLKHPQNVYGLSASKQVYRFCQAVSNEFFVEQSRRIAVEGFIKTDTLRWIKVVSK